MALTFPWLQIFLASLHYQSYYLVLRKAIDVQHIVLKTKIAYV